MFFLQKSQTPYKNLAVLNYLLLFLGLSLLLMSCGDQQRKVDRISTERFYKDRYNCNEEISIDLASFEKQLPSSSLISKVELIPLETLNKSVIGRPGSIVVTENMIFVVDNSRNLVVVFDSEGNFVETIDQIGEGRGEYLHLVDIVFNSYSGRLELLDSHGKLLAYDLNDGLLEVANVPELTRVHRVGIVDQDIIVFYAKYEDRLLHFYSRRRGKIVADALQVSFEMRNVRLDNTTKFYKRGEKLYFLDVYENSLYKLNGLLMDGQYCFNFGANNFSISQVPNQVEDDPLSFIKIREELNITFPIMYVHVSNGVLRFLTFPGGRNKGSATVVYDKDLSIIRHVKLDFIRDFAPSYVEFDESNILYAYSNKELLSNLESDLLTPATKRIIDDATENDNPIIVKIEIRD